MNHVFFIPLAANAIWNGLASKKRFLRLSVCAFLSIFGLFLFYRVEGGSFLKSIAEDGSLSGRVFTFFDLHDPFLSWWFSILIALSLFSSFAFTYEKLKSNGIEGKIKNRIKVLFSNSILFLVAMGALLMIVGLQIERHCSIAGEIALEKERIADRVLVSAPLDGIKTKALGFSILPEDIQNTHLRLLLNGDVSVEMKLGEQISFMGRRLDLRIIRPLLTGTRYVLLSLDSQTSESQTHTVAMNESFQFSDDSLTRFEVIEERMNAWGAGRGLKIAPIPLFLPGKDSSHYSEFDYEPFWVFLNRPNFDHDNRSHRYSFTFINVENDFEAIVGVFYRPGLSVSLFGLLLYAFALFFFMIFLLFGQKTSTHGLGDGPR